MNEQVLRTRFLKLFSDDWARSNWEIAKAEASYQIIKGRAGMWFELLSDNPPTELLKEIAWALASIGFTSDTFPHMLQTAPEPVDVRHHLRSTAYTWEEKAQTLNLVALGRAGFSAEELNGASLEYYVQKASVWLAIEITRTSDVDAFFQRRGFSWSPEEIRAIVENGGDLFTADTVRKMAERFSPDT